MKITRPLLVGVAAGLIVLFFVGARFYRAQQAASVRQAIASAEGGAAARPTPAGTVAPAATAAPAATTSPASLTQPLLIRPHSPVLGSATAAVTIVEFFDPECESCRAMYPIVKEVMKEFDGRARLVIRYMPLHPNSASAAALLEAARDQNKYWEFLDIMLFRQPEWADHHAPRPELLLTYAMQVGLDVERLKVDAARPEIVARIQQDQSDGVAFGARRTPTFFINGAQLFQLGYEPMREAVQAALR